MAQHGQAPLHVVELLDVGARGAGLEQIPLLDGVQLALERVDEGEVAVDHRVHQRVQHESRALAQQVRLALAALATPRKPRAAVVRTETT